MSKQLSICMFLEIIQEVPILNEIIRIRRNFVCIITFVYIIPLQNQKHFATFTANMVLLILLHFAINFRPPQKHGPRVKCSACKIVVHTSCLPIVMDRSQMACKPTFRDVGVRQYREQTTTHHHWVHRRTEKGKCQQCGKVSVSSCLSSSPVVHVRLGLRVWRDWAAIKYTSMPNTDARR